MSELIDHVKQAVRFINQAGTLTAEDETKLAQRLIEVVKQYEAPNQIGGKELFYKLVAILQQPSSVKYLPERARKLRARLKTFSEDDLIRAAQAVAEDEHMMGLTEHNSKKYANIDYLLRSDSLIDRWLAESEGESRNIDLSKVEI